MRWGTTPEARRSAGRRLPPSGCYTLSYLKLTFSGRPQVEVLADDLLKRAAPGPRPVEHLGAGELRLQDGGLKVIAGGVVRGREGVRSPSPPLGYHGSDLVFGQVIGELLRAGRIGTGEQPIVQGREGHPLWPVAACGTHDR